VARLPSGRFLIQMIGDRVHLFEELTEREIVNFSLGDQQEIVAAQYRIGNSDISIEDVAFAHFWSGYFYAHGCMGTPEEQMEKLVEVDKRSESEKDPKDPEELFTSMQDVKHHNQQYRGVEYRELTDDEAAAEEATWD